MPTNEAVLLPSIVELAEEAGRAILRVYDKTDFGVKLKAGQSPLTHADLASHRVILSGLRQLTPNIPIVSEESDDVAYEDRRHWGRFWLVDPLDGTREFISRNGEFTVNIALIQDGTPLLGVVHAPVVKVTYFASRETGAFKKKSDEEAVRIGVDSTRVARLRIVASRSHRSENLERVLEKIKNYECVNMGSSLKFCLIAEGSAHFYPRLGPTMEWDTAAGQCIVESAGGAVTDLSGSPLSYNKASLFNPNFVAGRQGLFQVVAGAC